MKLLAIRGRNLASLPRFHVRFDSEPLRRAGVFLISGPTGAGKSTLLDAMCLALYDKTPRLVSGEFDKGLKVGYQDDSVDLRLPAGDPRSLLRRGAVSAWAQVEFQIRGKGRFQSTWSVRRARHHADGKIQEVRLELRDLDRDRTISSDRKTETLKLIEELIGLSFPQFCRSVLLAQGEFAQFLRLRGDERADLLEKMTGTGVYAQLSRRAFERARGEVETWQRLQAERAAQHALRDSERAELLSKARELSAEREALAADGERLRSAERLHQQHRRLAEERAQAERALLSVESRSTEAEQLRLRLAALAAAQVLRPAYEESTRAGAEHKSVAEQAGRAALRQQAARTAQDQAQAAAQQAEQALQATRRAQEQTAPLLARARELDLRGQAAEESLAAATRTAAEAGREIDKRHAALAQKEKQVAQLEEARATHARWLEEHRAVAPLLPTWSQSQGALAQYREELTEVQKRDKRKAALERKGEQARRRFAELQQALVAPRQALAEHGAALKERRQELETQRLRHPPQQVRAAREGASAALGTLERLEEMVRQGQRLRQREEEQTARREHHEREAQHKTLLRAQATTRLAELEAAERQATRDLQVAREAEKLAARRPELLTPGEPCPLCGSVEHPAAGDHTPLGALTGRLESELAVLVRDIAATREARQKADTAAHAAQRLLEHAEQELRALAIERQEREAQFTQLAGRLPSPSPDLADLALFALSTLGQLQELRQRFAAQQAQAQAQESAAAALQQRAEEAQRQLDETRLQVDRLSEEQGSCGKALQEAEAGLLNVGELLEQGRLARSRLTELLADPLRELPGWAGHLAADPFGYLQWLEGEVAAYGQRAAQLDQAAARMQELAAALLALRTELERLTREQQTLLAAQQRAQATHEALRGERQSLPEPLGRRLVAEVEQEQRSALARVERTAAEAQRRLQETSHEHAQAQASARALDERLAAARAAAADSGQRLAAALRDFRAPRQGDAAPPTAEEESVAIMALLRVDESERRRLQRELAAFEEARAAAAGTLRDRAARQQEGEAVLRSFIQAAPTTLQVVMSEERAAAEALTATSARHAAVSEEYGAAAGRLREDDQLRERTASLIPAIEQQKAISDRWSQLSELIGSADGKKFRKFAQGLTLDALLDHANQHLSRLRPRYRLERVPGFDMDLQIIDRELGDEVRSCATLSGGETFLASLALALGLSALSAQSVPLESLFIDEGFGTLDDEALVQALDMLEELHGEGRQVGVISHVHDLTERISHQVVVEPRPPGQSRVYVRDGERSYESDDDEDDPADLALPAPRKAKTVAARVRKAAASTPRAVD